VLDTTGSRGEKLLRRTFLAVEKRLRREGHRLRDGVQVVAVPITIMGASRVEGDRRVVLVSQWALRSEMLDGLIAHELSHILRTDEGHPSHDGALMDESLREARLRHRVPKDKVHHLHQVLNHVQDVYADDIAMEVGVASRAGEFFLGWISGSLDGGSSDRWDVASRGVSNSFALGNLERHGLIAPDAEHYRLEGEFARLHDLRRSEAFRELFRDLPQDPDPRTMLSIDARLLDAYALEAGAPRCAKLDGGHRPYPERIE
jgi:hypothetical protein